MSSWASSVPRPERGHLRSRSFSFGSIQTMTPAEYGQGDGCVDGSSNIQVADDPIATMRGPNICGIQFDNEPAHIASAIAMCPSKPSDSAMA